jgi:hypothetical protein
MCFPKNVLLFVSISVKTVKCKVFGIQRRVSPVHKCSYAQSGHRYVQIRSTASPIMKAPSSTAYTSSMDGFSNLEEHKHKWPATQGLLRSKPLVEWPTRVDLALNPAHKTYLPQECSNAATDIHSSPRDLRYVRSVCSIHPKSKKRRGQ